LEFPVAQKALSGWIALRQKGIMSLEQSNPGEESCRKHFPNTL